MKCTWAMPGDDNTQGEDQDDSWSRFNECRACSGFIPHELDKAQDWSEYAACLPCKDYVPDDDDEEQGRWSEFV